MRLELSKPVNNWFKSTPHAKIEIEGHETIKKEIMEFLKENYMVRDVDSLGKVLSDPAGLIRGGVEE